VLLTGASSGIGRALALELAGRGVRLALVARREQLLEALVDEVANVAGERARVLVADLSVRGAAVDVARVQSQPLGRSTSSSTTQVAGSEGPNGMSAIATRRGRRSR
jgi:short-subunit dehydrogenase